LNQRGSEDVNQRRTDNTTIKKKNHNLQHATKKTNPSKTRGTVEFPRRVSSSCSTSDTRRVIVKRHDRHLIWKSCLRNVYVNNYKLHNKT